MAQTRPLDRLRVAWVSVLAASCLTLTLPVRGTAQGAGRSRPRRRTPITAILEAFRSFRVVSFPGGHTDPNESQALLRALVADPRFGATVNDIVVEFGSSRYQDVMDRYIRGEDVPDSRSSGRGSTRCSRGSRSTIRTPPRSSARFGRPTRSARWPKKRAYCSVTRRSTGRTSAARLTTASGKSSATPIRPTWSGGSCSRTTAAAT